MKLVIDIPKRVYDYILKRNTIVNSDRLEVAESIINGTKPKTGHWIKSRDSYGNNHFTCPFCENDIATKSDTWTDNYCSNCGANLLSTDSERE